MRVFSKFIVDGVLKGELLAALDDSWRKARLELGRCFPSVSVREGGLLPAVLALCTSKLPFQAMCGLVK